MILVLTAIAEAGVLTFLPATMPVQRTRVYAHTMVDGRVLVYGPVDNPIDSLLVDLFDPATDTFAPSVTVQCPEALYADTLADGRVFLFTPDPVTPCSEIFDPSTDTSVLLTAVAPNGDRSNTATMNAFPGSEVGVFGGGSGNTTLDTMILYDVGTDTWSTITMNRERRDHSSELLISVPNARVYMFGGSRQWFDLAACGGTCFEEYDSIEYYEVQTGVFVDAVPPLSVNRHKPATGAFGSTRVLVCGGHTGLFVTDTCDVYHTQTDSVTLAPSMNLARHDFTLFWEGQCFQIAGCFSAWIHGEGRSGDDTIEITNSLVGPNWVVEPQVLNTVTKKAAVAITTGNIMYIFGVDGPVGLINEVHSWVP